MRMKSKYLRIEFYPRLSTVLLAGAAIYMLANSSALFAQVVEGRSTEMLEGKDPIGKFEASLRLRMDLIQQDIQVTCGLSQDQSDKLAIAAKGVIRATAKRTLKLVDDPLDELSSQTLFNELQNQRLWQRAIEATLTEDQRSAYEKKLDARQQAIRDSAVQMYVSKVAGVLYLSDEQRGRFRALVDSTIGGKLAEMELYGEQNMLQAGAGFARVLGEEDEPDQVEAFEREDLAEIFSPLQLRLWETRFAPEVEELLTMRVFTISILEKLKGLQGVAPAPLGN